MKKKVLFICTHNSARSQMAEGFLRHFYGDFYEVFSAGTEPGRVHPFAVKVMKEAAVDISTHFSKSVDLFLGEEIDLVVTVCDHAREVCPYFPGARSYMHYSFPDPSNVEGSEELKLEVFRKVRDMISEWIKTTFNPLDIKTEN